MILRDYQDAAVASIFAYFESGGKGNPIVACPTGTGKSLIIGDFIRQACFRYPSTRIMKLTHVRGILGQNLEKLLALWPTAPAGVYSAGLKRKDVGFPIIFGGVGTVVRANVEIFGRIDLLLIDECHLLSPKESSMYQKVIARLKAINPSLKVIGFTATPYRPGQGTLIDEGGLFTDICFDLTGMVAFNWLLDQGYLSHLIPKRTNIELDVTGVHTTAGDYKQDELQAAVDRPDVNHAAIQEMIYWGHERKHWLVFASGIEHAIHVSNMLNDQGISATFVHSKMSDTECDANILAFTQGKYQAMVNNGILTTGFDFPGIDLIGMLRPTKSTNLWVQCLGRGTRPVYALGCDLSTAESRLAAISTGQKPNCLVLDFAGNTRRLGPINDPVLPRKKGKGSGEAPVKICEACGTYIHASLRFCPHCGTEFPRELKIAGWAGTDELITTGDVPVTEKFKVERVVYNAHYKEGRPPSIKVSYFCGLRMFKEFICLEHQGYARRKAREWWRERSLGEKPPETTAEALTMFDFLRTPSHINVWLKKGSYDEIIGYDYERVE